MPARKRVSKPVSVRAASAKRTARLALDMEEPLNDALDAAHALRFMGCGLAQHIGDEEGRAVVALAWMTCRRLDALQQLWRQLFKCAAQAKEKGGMRLPRTNLSQVR
jgi:hypothetical protein